MCMCAPYMCAYCTTRVCMCVFVRVYCLGACVFVYVCVHEYVCVSVCVCAIVLACVRVYTCMRMYARRVCLCVVTDCRHVCVYICA